MSAKTTRSARHVKTAATLLQKEARKILKRHAGRIAADPADEMRACVAAIDTYRAAANIDALEREAERLDELLHRHATFARKSAFRETAENIAVAVLIALGLRSCFYEPFKIPSGSMMPTLRKGDHIFVNKFVYGVQIPFTSTVVGQSLGEIERGDVIVFRYPLNEAEDFIKRVIGLPGDEVKVQGRSVSIKRAGEAVFETLGREALEEPCYDDDGQQVVPDCQLYKETLGERSYVVRYMSNFDEQETISAPARIWKVPQERVLVMGDNRNQSHDSLAWTIRVEAVSAEDVLRVKDLRDLTSGKVFTLVRPESITELSDPSHDHVIYRSNHRAERYDLSLAVWRDPPIAAAAVFEAVRERLPAGRQVRVDDLLATQPDNPQTDRARQIGAAIDGLAIGETSGGRLAVAYLQPAQAVLELGCGREVCASEADLALQMTKIIGEFERDRDQDARNMVPRHEDARYGTHWTGRSDVHDHFYETTLHPAERDQTRQSVRLRALRKPKEDLAVLEAAALHEVGRSHADADRLPALAERAWSVAADEVFTIIAANPDNGMMIIVDCGRDRCRDAKAAEALATKIWSRVPESALDRRKMRQLLQAQDLPGTQLVARKLPERAPYDRVTLEATVEGEGHSVELEVWRQPAEGLAAKVASLRQTYGLEPDDAVASGGGFTEDGEGFHYVFPVEESQTVLRLRCRTGLCSSPDMALQIARRARAHATDPTTFIDPEAERPRPFVPRGHVKGRAERIWLPMNRFWLPIR